MSIIYSTRHQVMVMRIFLTSTAHKALIALSLDNTNSHSFVLFDTLHVPKITKTLISVQKFYIDNNCYFKFFLYSFLIKDQENR